MPVASNTSPLIGLSIIGKLHLLEEQCDEVVIPPAVRKELRADSAFRGAKLIQQALRSGWIREQRIQNTHLAQALALELDYGESEAIALALELNIHQILMDESDGRAKARALGLFPIGVLGILLRAKRQGSLVSLKDEMSALRQEAGFFIAEELYRRLLAEAGEG